MFVLLGVVCKTLFPGTRTARNLVSGTDAQIQRYSDKCRELESALQQTAAINAEIVVFRVMSAVGDIGFFLNPHAIGIHTPIARYLMAAGAAIMRFDADKVLTWHS